VAATSEAGTAPATGKDGGLSSIAIRGASFLVRREGIGMLIRLVGVVLTVRAVGPAGYGIYSAALAFMSVAAIFSQMGVEVYLIRQPGEIGEQLYARTYTLLYVSSVVVTVVCLAITVVAAPVLRPVGVVEPLRVLLLCVPTNVLWAPGQAAIERRFGYREMGWLEIGGDIVLYGTAVPLALLHFGAWALVAGYFAWQLFLLVGSIAFSGLRPGFDWSGETMVDLVRYGAPFSASRWMQQLSGVVNAMVVGTFVGAAGVGIVSFALRLVDTLGFAARGAYRLGIVALSKVGDGETARLRYAIEEGILLQMLALGVPFACFGLIAPWVVPALFGHQWESAVRTYSVMAMVVTLTAPSVVLGVYLLSRGKNIRILISVGTSVVVLAAAAVPLVAWLGPVGFGWASALALVDTLYLDHQVRKTVQVRYRMILAFACVLCAPILFPLAPMPEAVVLLAPMALLVVVPALRRETFRLARVVRSSFQRLPS